MEPKSEIVMERQLVARLDDIWALWTDPREMERWWGPHGFVVRIKALDLRVGGRMDYVMATQNPAMIDFLRANGMPEEQPTTLTYTEVTPMTRLAWRHAVDFVPNHPPYDTHHGVTFAQVGDAVHLRVTIERMHNDEWTNRSRMGWEEELDKLVALVAARAA